MPLTHSAVRIGSRGAIARLGGARETMRRLATLSFALALVSGPSLARAWASPKMCAAEPEALWSDSYGICGVPSLELPVPILAPYEVEIIDTTALKRARRFLEEGEHRSALQALIGLERHFPRIADHIALVRGEAAFGAELHELALEAFEAAGRSVDGTVRLRARIGKVRALLALDRPEGRLELQRLLDVYPELPQRLSLLYERAENLARTGSPEAAVDILRTLDLENPGTSAAGKAREKLAALARSGVRVPPLTKAERVQRVERLVWDGPMDRARDAVDGLLREPALPRDLRRRAYTLAARIARVEGRFADRDRFTQLARSGAEADLEEQGAPSDEERLRDALADVRRLQGGRPLGRVPTHRLIPIAQAAARGGADDVLETLLRVALTRRIPATVRFELALIASGGVHDERVAALLRPITGLSGSLGSGARYHYARALHRLGRVDAAEQAYQRARSNDQSGVHYYSMWSNIELASLREGRQLGPGGGDGPALAELSTSGGPPSLERVGVASGAARPPRPATDAVRESAMNIEGNRLEGFRTRRSRMEPPPIDHDSLADQLRGIAELHELGYPQLGRAVDLLRLGDVLNAQNEIYEAFLAWRAVTGRPIRRVGLESVARGADRPLPGGSVEARRARLGLTADHRRVIAAVASGIGDYGTAVSIGPDMSANDRPRAYAREVEAAAAEFGLDPNLLFAVMRVESVYQRGIISYAGAIGLMQIMPRTGTLIGHAIGAEDFTTADLLDPATNVRFAAWYLSSLIRRFDGRLPLAIASYNGGPHNVRYWLEQHSPTMPLDALLERIPFSQTHRYVRRVLTHYAAYRAQQGLPMERLNDTLPSPGPDRTAF